MTAKRQTTKKRSPAKRTAQRTSSTSHNPTRGKLTPGRLTPEQREHFFELLRRPIPLRYACDLAKIPRRTVYDWIERGSSEKATKVYRDFAAEVAEAQGSGLGELAGLVHKHALEDHRAATWYLSRMAPEEFGDPGKRATLAHERALHEQELRRSRALADMAEAKAAIVAAAVKGEGRGVVLTPVDLVELLPETMREPFQAALKEHGLALMVLRDLADELDEDLTESEMMDATGLGPGGASPEAG